MDPNDTRPDDRSNEKKFPGSLVSDSSSRRFDFCFAVSSGPVDVNSDVSFVEYSACLCCAVSVFGRALCCRLLVVVRENDETTTAWFFEKKDEDRHNAASIVDLHVYNMIRESRLGFGSGGVCICKEGTRGVTGLGR